MADGLTSYAAGGSLGRLRQIINNEFVKKTSVYTKDEIDSKLGDVQGRLPIPELVFVPSETGDSGTLKLANDWTGYADVTVRYKQGFTPVATDAEFPAEGLSLSSNGSWYVRAFPAEGALVSASPSAIYPVEILKARTPQISFDSVTKTASITCPTSGATIRYTLDGSDPTSSSAAYSASIVISSRCTIKAKAFKTGLRSSDVASYEASVARIFGVRFLLSGPTSGTRLTPANDPFGFTTETVSVEPKAQKGSTAGQSIFDNYGPWQLKMRNFTNGQPGAWHGESGFTLTGADVMVYLPRAYFAIHVTNTYIYMYIADDPHTGFELAPWSDSYMARYETSSNNESKSGKSATVSQTISTMRNNARAKGNGWGLRDIVVNSALQWLIPVEYASYDINSKIGTGYTDYTTGASGAPQFTTSGKTDSMAFHTGVTSTSDTGSVQYRYIENPWGNHFEFCDGFNTVGGVHYVCTDRDNYASGRTTGYTRISSGGYGVKNPTSNNGFSYITKMTYVEEMPWLIGIPSPSSGDGSSSTYYCNAGYLEGSGDSVLVVGRYFYLIIGINYPISHDAGLFTFFDALGTSDTSAYVGSRLTYKEAA